MSGFCVQIYAYMHICDMHVRFKLQLQIALGLWGLHGISTSVHYWEVKLFTDTQFVYDLFQIMYILDSHFWHHGKQTCRETKHRVPPALSAMGGQSSLVRLPPLDYPYPYHAYPYFTNRLLHAGGKEREVFAVREYQVVRWFGKVLC